VAPQKVLIFDLTFPFFRENSLDNDLIEVETCRLVKLIYLSISEAVF
jgi:hypothetical protein